MNLPFGDSSYVSEYNPFRHHFAGTFSLYVVFIMVAGIVCPHVCLDSYSYLAVRYGFVWLIWLRLRDGGLWAVASAMKGVSVVVIGDAVRLVWVLK